MSSPHGPNQPPPQVPPANLPPLPDGYVLEPAPQHLSPTPLYTAPPKRNPVPAEKPDVRSRPITNAPVDHDKYGIDAHRDELRAEKAAARNKQPGHEAAIAPYRLVADLGNVAFRGSQRHGERAGQPVSKVIRVASGVGAALLGATLTVGSGGVMPLVSGIGMGVRWGANKNRGRDNPLRRRVQPREGEIMQPGNVTEHTFHKSGRFAGPGEYADADPGYTLHPLPQPHQPNQGNQGGHNQQQQPQQTRRQQRKAARQAAQQQAQQTQQQNQNQQQQPPQPQNPNQTQQPPRPQPQPNRPRRRGRGQPQPTPPQTTAGNRNRRTPQTPPAQPVPGTQGNQPPNPNPNTGTNQPHRARRPRPEGL